MSNYHVAPIYSNVDIRITISIYNASVEIYVAKNEEIARITTGEHGRFIRLANSNESSIAAFDLSKETQHHFVTFEKEIVKLLGVSYKVTIIIPKTGNSKVKENNFYITVFPTIHQQRSFVSIHFDQAYTSFNMLIFLAAFFSSLFFCLGIVLLIWKVKQQRILQQRQEAAEDMKSRPYQIFHFLYQNESSYTVENDTNESKTAVCIQEMKNKDTRLGTFMIQLPQGSNAKLCVASTFISSTTSEPAKSSKYNLLKRLIRRRKNVSDTVDKNDNNSATDNGDNNNESGSDSNDDVINHPATVTTTTTRRVFYETNV